MTEISPKHYSHPWIKNYDSHIPSTIQYAKKNLVSLFEKAAERYSDKPFISINEIEFSFGRVRKLIENLSKDLISIGLKKGDRIALILPNI